MKRSLEELLFHMRPLCGSENDWEAGFARSICRAAKDSSWRPSPKQEAIMQRLVAERFTEEGDIQLIE